VDQQLRGRFIGIEPNGDVYNCSEFADTQEPEYCFGNLFTADSIEPLLNGQAALAAKRRRYRLPVDCQQCRHFAVCEGGCMRDAALYGRGLGGKFYYCESWMRVFDRIRESIANGEADQIVRRFGLTGDLARLRSSGELQVTARQDVAYQALHFKPRAGATA